MTKIWLTRRELRALVREAASMCEGCGCPMSQCECDMMEADEYCDACENKRDECTCEVIEQ
jgi:hypothetical protein